MAVYTFITDRAGGTYLRQFTTPDLKTAITEWLEGEGLTDVDFPMDLIYEAVPVDGLDAVWCTSLLDDDDVSWIVHIVKTDTLPSAPEKKG